MSHQEQKVDRTEVLINRITLFGVLLPIVFTLEVICSTTLASIFLGHQSTADGMAKRWLFAGCVFGVFCHATHLRSILWFRITTRGAAIAIGGYLLVWIIGFILAYCHVLPI